MILVQHLGLLSKLFGKFVHFCTPVLREFIPGRTFYINHVLLVPISYHTLIRICLIFGGLIQGFDWQEETLLPGIPWFHHLVWLIPSMLFVFLRFSVWNLFLFVLKIKVFQGLIFGKRFLHLLVLGLFCQLGMLGHCIIMYSLRSVVLPQYLSLR